MFGLRGDSMPSSPTEELRPNQVGPEWGEPQTIGLERRRTGPGGGSQPSGRNKQARPRMTVPGKGNQGADETARPKAERRRPKADLESVDALGA